MKWEYNDGGRSDAGYQGDTGDCVVRAIAIATGQPYRDVYNAMWLLIKEEESNLRTKIARLITRGKRKPMSPRSGMPRKLFHKYLTNLGWKWVPTMQIGQGTTVHLSADELPAGRLIVRVSKHITTVIDGVIHDTFDCSRDEKRCVYGYYIQQ